LGKFLCIPWRPIPEPLDSDSNEQKTAANYCTKLKKPLVISELTKERLRRVAKSVKSKNSTYSGDVGFRSFKLDCSNINQWESNRDNVAESLFANQEHLRKGRTEADLVYEIVLKLGLDLCVSMDTRQIAGKTVGAIGGGVLMVCLSDAIKDEDIEGLANGIIKFNQDLRPVGHPTFIFKDSAFGGDSAKLNLSSIIEQHLDCNVKSI
jgi:adenine-specific DNA-methyltransferase